MHGRQMQKNFKHTKYRAKKKAPLLTFFNLFELTFSLNISLYQFKVNAGIPEDCHSKESTIGWWGWLFGSNEVPHEDSSTGCLYNLIWLLICPYLFSDVNESHMCRNMHVNLKF